MLKFEFKYVPVSEFFKAENYYNNLINSFSYPTSITPDVNDRESEYNESTELVYDLFLEDVDDEIIPIEKYVTYCKNFARAVGFSEKTIEEAFSGK